MKTMIEVPEEWFWANPSFRINYPASWRGNYFFISQQIQSP